MKRTAVAICILLSILFLPGLAQTAQKALPGTETLQLQGDLSLQMQAMVDDFLLKLTAESVQSREKLWNRDYSSAEAYEESVAGNRKRFIHYIGLADERISKEDLVLVSTLQTPLLVAETERLQIFSVRWPVLETGNR